MRAIGIVRCASLFPNSRMIGGLVVKHKLIRYSMQIAMLRQLLALSLINEKEFRLMKSKTMREYGIISDLTS
ncbi:hypothetical protein [Paenibacillus sp. FSL K6-3166]|uniref:hypothetical protein n=1 Tax=Paenibacillus sp. FSL K6-3166 TaxID=2921492 RepID=UPI004046F572